jgi:uncharacterized protein (TIGR00369 family)
MFTEYEPRDPRFREKIRDSFNRQDAMATLGVSVVDVQPGRVELAFPFQQKLTQQHDFIHAGIVSTVLDSACGYAAFSLMATDAAVLTVEFKVNLLSPAAGDEFHAIGQVQKNGRTILVAGGEMVAHDGDSRKTVATMTATLMAVRGRDGIVG